MSRQLNLFESVNEAENPACFLGAVGGSFVFTATKDRRNANSLFLRNIVYSTFEDNTIQLYQNFYHNDITNLGLGYYLVSLSKAKGAKRRYLRSIISLSKSTLS